MLYAPPEATGHALREPLAPALRPLLHAAEEVRVAVFLCTETSLKTRFSAVTQSKKI